VRDRAINVGVVTVGAFLAILFLGSSATASWSPLGRGRATTTGSIILTGKIGPGLIPGTSVPVNLAAANNGTSSAKVGTVSLVSVSAPAGCEVAIFTMAPVTENFTVPAGAAAQALPNAATLSMANETANKHACEGIPLTLTLSST